MNKKKIIVILITFLTLSILSNIISRTIFEYFKKEGFDEFDA